MRLGTFAADSKRADQGPLPPFLWDVHRAARLLRGLEWRVRKTLGSLLSGEYRSALRGKGREFDSVVKYEFGDDVRDIDWNVTARMGELYRKKFVEERELSIVLVFEDSPSLSFRLGGREKRGVLLEWAAVLGLLARSNQDRLGLWYGDGQKSRFFPPARNRGAVLATLTFLLSTRGVPVWENRAVQIPWEFFLRVLPRHTVLFWLGDFPPRPKPPFWGEILRRFEPIGLRILDPLEEELLGYLPSQIFDPTTGDVFYRRRSSWEELRAYRQWWESREQSWRGLFPPANRWTARTDQEVILSALSFFRHRARLLLGR
jgi:uncharacterized protein (DUF58 family)